MQEGEHPDGSFRSWSRGVALRGRSLGSSRLVSWGSPGEKAANRNRHRGSESPLRVIEEGDAGLQAGVVGRVSGRDRCIWEVQEIAGRGCRRGIRLGGGYFSTARALGDEAFLIALD